VVNVGMSVNFHGDGSQNFRVERGVYQLKTSKGRYSLLRLFAGGGHSYQELNLYLTENQLQELKGNIILLLAELIEKKEGKTENEPTEEEINQ
jgi:hypothetical protein